MEKQNMYPEMPQNQVPGSVPNAPPSYNQSFATAPSEGTPMMPSYNSGPMQPQPVFAQQPQTFIVQNPAPLPPLGPRPCLVTCPTCHQQNMSTVVMQTSTKTHLFAAFLCIIGCFCCACMPYCIDACKTPNHYCSNCNAYLGMYSK